ncbi:MAG: biopolymer transporter ExbD [Gammaproteobacteria bacterium]|nr:biopolymer transporter ExbD [Gammaproteobacteria bacterium]
MKFRPFEQEDEASVNLTPLIDVVFLLLIFFMVSTTFDTTSEIKVELPQASPEQRIQQVESLSIVIDPRGYFYLNGKRLKNQSADLLLLELHRVVGNNKELPVVIKSDAGSPVQAMVTALDVVGRMGLQRLSIATTKPVE